MILWFVECLLILVYTVLPLMKRHILNFVLVALVLLVAACKGHEADTFKIGVSQCSQDVWREQMNREMQRETMFYNKNVKLDIRSAHDDNALQIKQIDSLVNEGINLLVVSPNEARAFTPVVERVMRRGIPVIVVDRKTLSDKYTAFIGADNRSIGKDMAACVVQELKGHGTVVELTGRMAGTAARERHDGLTHMLAQAPGIKVLASVEVGWEGPRVQQQVDSLIAAGVVPQIITAPNDRTGVKVHQALVAAGHPEVKVIGVDGLSTKGGGLDNVEQGVLTATFVYPTGGDKVIQTAMRILRHEPFKRDTRLHSAVINATTARLFRIQSDQVHESEQRIDKLGTQMDKFLSRYSMQKMLLFACIAIIVLIGLVMAMGIRSYYVTIRRNEELDNQKRKLEAQRDQLVKMSKELEETTQSKLTFFTEVSHDLRTPLTLILAPVEQLQGADNLTDEQRGLLQVVRTNADILLRLVGQTLDFRKFETGQLRLNVKTVQLNETLKQWCDPFRALARKKMVRYHVQQADVPDAAWLDVMLDDKKMESVLYNLLSNAFKYTPEGGKITVTPSITDDAEQGRWLSIVVEDSGQGIDRDKLPHIFDRFYQADASHDGSGIGLATVKAFVELHGGTVSAESVRGNGTRFVVCIPCQHDAATAHVYEQPDAMQPDGAGVVAPHIDAIAGEGVHTVPNALTASADAAQARGGAAEPRPTVLVIDDNEDIRSYLRLLLADGYVVETAADGQEGLAKARQLIPDAVVCDVMMPVMDGWECCRRLKDEWQTSHIPVMMLTACTLDEQRVAGFDCGADSYIAKPFSPDMFKARLRNLIDNRRRLKAFFGDKTSLKASNVSELDKGFAARLRDMIEKNMSSENFSVEDMAAQMGVGRTQLYRKVKSLMGFSPVELLRIARLKKAAELLRRTEMTVAEVAYEVGFASPSYMAKCFKEYFGVNPTEYK